MAKVIGLRQQRVQFFYDTLFKSRGDVTVTNVPATDLASAETIMFTTNPTALDRTNMPASGFLTSDQTFLCYAVRHELQFYQGHSAIAQEPFDDTAAVFILALNSYVFRFQVSEKVEFEGPWSMTPAGGGPWGFVSDSTQPLLTNGEPQARSIYVLPLPIAITKRQGIQMLERCFNLTGTVVNAGIDVPTMINTYSGLRLGRTYIDGYNTRDVL
jgi:hypothetical protein